MRRRTYLTAVGSVAAATALLDGRGESRAPARAVRRPVHNRTRGPLRVGIYVTEALARTARDTGYWSVTRPAARVAEQMTHSTDLLDPRLVAEPVAVTERDDHRRTWATWRETDTQDDAALLLTTTRDGEFDGYGGGGYAVAEAEDLVYYAGHPQATGGVTEPFVRTLAVALHEVGHALGLDHDLHATVTMPGGERYVTLMGVGAPGVDCDGIVLRYSERAMRELSGGS